MYEAHLGPDITHQISHSPQEGNAVVVPDGPRVGGLSEGRMGAEEPRGHLEGRWTGTDWVNQTHQVPPGLQGSHSSHDTQGRSL